MIKPAGCFADFQDYLNQEEDDYRTLKEQKEDMGDYLADRDFDRCMDLSHELVEKNLGAR